MASAAAAVAAVVRAASPSAYGYVQIPIYQRVNRIQIVSPYHLFLGLTFSPGL